MFPCPVLIHETHAKLAYCSHACTQFVHIDTYEQLMHNPSNVAIAGSLPKADSPQKSGVSEAVADPAEDTLGQNQPTTKAEDNQEKARRSHSEDRSKVQGESKERRRSSRHEKEKRRKHSRERHRSRDCSRDRDRDRRHKERKSRLVHCDWLFDSAHPELNYALWCGFAIHLIPSLKYFCSCQIGKWAVTHDIQALSSSISTAAF